MLRPCGTRLLVKVHPEPTHSPSGSIILPDDMFTTEPLRGEIIAKGPKCSSEVAVGDTVVLHRFASDSVKEIEKGIHLMEEKALIGKLISSESLVTKQ